MTPCAYGLPTGPCTAAARPYPCGWRCETHAPGPVPPGSQPTASTAAKVPAVAPEDCRCQFVRMGAEILHAPRRLLPGDPLPTPSAVRGCCRENRCSPLLPSGDGRAMLCVDCGFTTTRHDTDGLPRCLGSQPEFPACTVCGEPVNSVLTAGVHPFCVEENARVLAITRDLEKLGMGHCTCREVGAGTCPCCKELERRVAL